MKGLSDKLTKELREYASVVVGTQNFDLLCEEIEKAYYADWRQSTTLDEREDVWSEFQGFRRMAGTFRGLSMQKKTGDGDK